MDPRHQWQNIPPHSWHLRVCDAGEFIPAHGHRRTLNTCGKTFPLTPGTCGSATLGNSSRHTDTDGPSTPVAKHSPSLLAPAGLRRWGIHPGTRTQTDPQHLWQNIPPHSWHLRVCDAGEFIPAHGHRRTLNTSGKTFPLTPGTCGSATLGNSSQHTDTDGPSTPVAKHSPSLLAPAGLRRWGIHPGTRTQTDPQHLWQNIPPHSWHLRVCDAGEFILARGHRRTLNTCGKTFPLTPGTC
nr:uncharacterized protein LOC115111037 [Oncorhynchus nerka]